MLYFVVDPTNALLDYWVSVAINLALLGIFVTGCITVKRWIFKRRG